MKYFFANARFGLMMHNARAGGYSLTEVIVSVFILTGLVLYSFTVFETGSHALIKADNEMVAARLAQKVCEELHSYASSNIQTTSPTFFALPYPLNQYTYSYSVSAYADTNPSISASLQQITVTVSGPLRSNGNASAQTANVTYAMLLAGQPYP